MQRHVTPSTILNKIVVVNSKRSPANVISKYVYLQLCKFPDIPTDGAVLVLTKGDNNTG